MKLEKAINPLLDDDLLVAISYLFERILSEHLMNVENSWPFHHAVNKLRFKDYYDIVKTPMDLEKIKNVKYFQRILAFSFYLNILFRIFSNIHIVHVHQC
jgi:hypothetical protein